MNVYLELRQELWLVWETSLKAELSASFLTDQVEANPES